MERTSLSRPRFPVSRVLFFERSPLQTKFSSQLCDGIGNATLEDVQIWSSQRDWVLQALAELPDGSRLLRFAFVHYVSYSPAQTVVLGCASHLTPRSWSRCCPHWRAYSCPSSVSASLLPSTQYAPAVVNHNMSSGIIYYPARRSIDGRGTTSFVPRGLWPLSTQRSTSYSLPNPTGRSPREWLCRSRLLGS